MTGGRAVILGAVGDNFGAGMTGGMAFIYDREDRLPARINGDSVVFARLGAAYWEAELISLIEAHEEATRSPLAAELLHNWDQARLAFWQICPKEMLSRIPHPLSDSDAEMRA